MLEKKVTTAGMDVLSYSEIYVPEFAAIASNTHLYEIRTQNLGTQSTL